jgi:hypothetical protein
MGEIVSFANYRPPARYDGVPWANARVDEAATGDGVWATIDLLPLTPIDPDPTDPLYRSFTTDQGTSAGLWYRLVFVDAADGTSQPTWPFESLPLPAAVAAYTTTDELFRVMKIRQPTPAQVVAGQRVIDAAALEIDREIGRNAPYDQPPALAVEVNLERAVEHWRSEEAPFGVIGFDSSLPTPTARDSWERYALKLAPLKERWAIA